MPVDPRTRLRACGLRPTRPRRVIVRVLAESGATADPKRIHERARLYDSRISLSTVYRFLARLRRDGGLANPAAPAP